MADFTLDQILSYQRALQDRYQHKWEPICPATGQNKMLWMVGELGEAIDIVKKHGHEAAVSDPALRCALVEELADVLMYYGDIMLCYGISTDELKASYEAKFHRNMNRW